MKKDLVLNIVIIILGLLILFGPMTLFKVCDHSMSMNEGGVTEMQDGEECEVSEGEDTYTVCHWTARAELGTGIVVIALGILLIVLKKEGIQLGLSIAVLLNGIYALAVPTILIGVCESSHMRCHMLAKPALIIVSVFLIIISAIKIGAYYKKKEA